MEGLATLWQSTGIASIEYTQIIMMLVGGLLIYLAIKKQFEPLLWSPLQAGWR